MKDIKTYADRIFDLSIPSDAAAYHALMELRDHFAAAALTGLFAHGGAFFSDEYRVSSSFQLADKMIKARELKEPDDYEKV